MSDAKRFFVDTNVLLYSLSPTDAPRQIQAAEWLEFLWGAGLGCLSWQVLHEFNVNATRKLSIPPPTARRCVRDFIAWHPVDTSWNLVQRAWHWMDSAQLNYWDALILAAAEISDCPYLLSEDFQAGRRYGNILVVNPFASTPTDFA